MRFVFPANFLKMGKISINFRRYGNEPESNVL